MMTGPKELIQMLRKELMAASALLGFLAAAPQANAIPAEVFVSQLELSFFLIAGFTEHCQPLDRVDKKSFLD